MNRQLVSVVIAWCAAIPASAWVECVDAQSATGKPKLAASAISENLLNGKGVYLGSEVQAIPADGFRLTVSRLYEDRDELILLLTLESASAQRFAVWSSGESGVDAFSGAVTAMAGSNGKFKATVQVVVTQIAVAQGQFVKARVGRGSSTVVVPKGSELVKSVSITVKDGVYPLNKPVVLGVLLGAQLHVAVGASELVEELSK